MAWRIEKSVIRAEFDFRVAGKIRGQLWLNGMAAPVAVDLAGVPHEDLQGQVLIMQHRETTKPIQAGFAKKQQGTAGDMTASRKVKVHDVPVEQVYPLVVSGKDFSWHWGNAVYLEWFSEVNGKVVIESVDMDLRLNDPTSVIAVDVSSDDFDDDAPQSRREAEADAYSEFMNTLTERVASRLENGGDFEDYEKIFQEERKKLRAQYGIASPIDVDRDDDDSRNENDDVYWQEPWVDDEESAESEMESEMADEAWKLSEEEEESWLESDESEDDHNHPLVNACLNRSEMMYRAIQENGWLPETEQEDHPLEMLHHAVMFAGVKLSGALMDAVEQWPPDADEAAHILVNLKAARRQFRDALLALQSCKEEGLAEVEWLAEVEAEVNMMLAEVNDFIQDARDAIATTESSD